jgi:hypothetical protein
MSKLEFLTMKKPLKPILFWILPASALLLVPLPYLKPAMKMSDKGNSAGLQSDVKRDTDSSEVSFIRKGPRQAAGELERYRHAKALESLEKAVADQEDKVDERRKLLETITRAKDIIYRGGSGTDDETMAKEVEDFRADRAEYPDVKKQLELDLKVLEEMKLKLSAEQTKKLESEGD